ncbi:MAG: heme exporter protein CcmD [Pseudomonadales bacterium]|nr:heme exporter protein CcmD [Pseudomonadales bacterium]
MFFDSFSALLHMQGHGVFVWSAYAISVLVVVLCIVQPSLRYGRELKRLAASRRATASPGGGSGGGDKLQEHS